MKDKEGGLDAYVEQSKCCFSGIELADKTLGVAGLGAIGIKALLGMVSQITAILAENNINIPDMLKKSRGNYAFTLIDINERIPPKLLACLIAIKGVLSAGAID